MHPLCVIIPCRRGSRAEITLRSLAVQDCHEFDVHIVQDEELRGQAWALNQGLAWARAERYSFVLPSDDDICWEPQAIGWMLNATRQAPHVDFVYGTYEIGGKPQCDVEFDVAQLRRVNYISTMTLVRLACAPNFDESLVRLIDWDYWLTMVENGCVGMHCGRLIFHTATRLGITESDKQNNRIRKEAVAIKHNLPLEAVL